jgi:hypothetical protein
MQGENLVLFKSRTYRLSEMIVMPTIGLAVGPTMRALLGDQYSISLGLLAALLLMVLMRFLSARLAIWRGGEWVTQAERLRRLVDEAAATPRWQNAAAMTAMAALTLCGIYLIVEPFDEFGDFLRGAPDSVGLIALVAVFLGVRVLLTRQPKPVVVEEAPPPGYFWSELRRVVVRIWLASGIGGAVGLTIGMHVPESWRFGSFMIAFVAISLSLLQQLSRSASPRRVYASLSNPSLAKQMLLGVLLWGVPMGIAFSGIVMLSAMDPQERMPVGIGLALVFALSVGGGLAFGALVHLVGRLSEPARRG